MHEVLVNRLGGLSLPRKSVVRLTDRPDMTLDVYRGRKTTIQQQQPGEFCSRCIIKDTTSMMYDDTVYWYCPLGGFVLPFIDNQLINSTMLFNFDASIIKLFVSFNQ